MHAEKPSLGYYHGNYKAVPLGVARQPVRKALCMFYACIGEWSCRTVQADD